MCGLIASSFFITFSGCKLTVYFDFFVIANFMPMVKIPTGLVGMEAANVPAQTGPLNVSIKHPLIEIQ